MMVIEHLKRTRAKARRIGGGINQGEIQSLCWSGEAFKEVTTKAMAGGKGGG